MDEQISWRVELTVKPGQLDNFQALTGEMVTHAKTESGVLSYQRFVSGDGKIVHVHERYADSASALHLEAFRGKIQRALSGYGGADALHCFRQSER